MFSALSNDLISISIGFPRDDISKSCEFDEDYICEISSRERLTRSVAIKKKKRLILPSLLHRESTFLLFNLRS